MKFLTSCSFLKKSLNFIYSIKLTGGGPGRATELPSTFMYSYTFTRNAMGIGASSAVIMLMMVAAVVVPYLYAEIQRGKNEQR